MADKRMEQSPNTSADRYDPDSILRAVLEREVQRLQANLKGWAARINAATTSTIDSGESVAYVLEWSEREIGYAAKLLVCRTIQHWLSDLEQPKSYDDVRSMAMNMALNGARNPDRSTSAMARTMSQNVTEHWARFAKEGTGAI